MPAAGHPRLTRPHGETSTGRRCAAGGYPPRHPAPRATGNHSINLGIKSHQLKIAINPLSIAQETRGAVRWVETLRSLPGTGKGGLAGLARGETARSSEALETSGSSRQPTSESSWKGRQNAGLFSGWWHTGASPLTKPNTTPAVTKQTRWSGSSGEAFDLRLSPRPGSPDRLKPLRPGMGSWRPTRLLRASSAARGDGASREIPAICRTQRSEESKIRAPNVSITNPLKITGR